MEGTEIRYYTTICILCVSTVVPFYNYADYKEAKDSLKNHRVSKSRWNQIFEKQGRRCAVCKCTEPKGVKRKYWCIDHDRNCCPGVHSCGKCVRGILCSYCNRGLGSFQDNLESLKGAIDYLQGYKNTKSRTSETKRKISEGWTTARRLKQSETLRGINNLKIRKDYTCPDCERVFEKVTKHEYGGHRKTCVYWKNAAELIQKQEGKTLDEILDSSI